MFTYPYITVSTPQTDQYWSVLAGSGSYGIGSGSDGRVFLVGWTLQQSLCKDHPHCDHCATTDKQVLHSFFVAWLMIDSSYQVVHEPYITNTYLHIDWYRLIYGWYIVNEQMVLAHSSTIFNVLIVDDSFPSGVKDRALPVAHFSCCSGDTHVIVRHCWWLTASSIRIVNRPSPAFEPLSATINHYFILSSWSCRTKTAIVINMNHESAAAIVNNHWSSFTVIQSLSTSIISQHEPSFSILNWLVRYQPTYCNIYLRSKH